MTNRREVIQAGIAVSAASATGAAAHAAQIATPSGSDAGAATAAPLKLDGMVFDKRFPQAIEVVQSAARYGVPLHEMAADTADFWYDHLRPLWRGPHAAFAGITTIDATFVFQTLAADHRLRLIYRGMHEAPEHGVVAHLLSGPASMIDAAGLGAHRGPWTQRVGYLITHGPASGAVKTVSATTDAEPSAGRRDALVSWIVAPASWNLAPVGLRTLMRCGGMYGHTQA